MVSSRITYILWNEIKLQLFLNKKTAGKPAFFEFVCSLKACMIAGLFSLFIYHIGYRPEIEFIPFSYDGMNDFIFRFFIDRFIRDF